VKTKVCTKCGARKQLDQFHVKDKQRGTRRARCKPCWSIYRRQHYLENQSKYIKMSRARVVEHRRRLRFLILEAKAKPCADCDLSYPPWVMQFDHVRGRKLFHLGAYREDYVSVPTLLNEIKKCDVVCANCHADRTYKRNPYDIPDSPFV
jgi:hypothetical protein